METTLYEVTFLDGRIFRVFCRGKNQKKRFLEVRNKLVNKNVTEIANGIHDIKEFEQLMN